MSSTEIAPASMTVSQSCRSAAITLVILAPLIAEVMSGSTRLSFIFVFIPEMMVWGCGALIIRELVRRWEGGGTSLLLGGLALAMTQEFIIQQTSLAPLPWIQGPIYGRQWGVNWVFFLFLLGFESVWVVLVPVQLTELLFHSRGKQPWLRKSGLAVASAIFLVGSFLAWFLWTRIARPNKFHVPPYHPSPLLLGIGACVTLLLLVAAYIVRNSGREKSERQTPSPWMAGGAALVFCFLWYALIAMVFAPTLRPKFSFWIPMVLGVAWGVLAFSVIRRWSRSRGWSDMHRWSVAFAAAIVSMVMGFGGSSAWPKIDVNAKIAMNITMTIWLLWLGLCAKKHSLRSEPVSTEPTGQPARP